MTLKRLRLRGSTLKPAEAPAETEAPSGGFVTSIGPREGEVAARLGNGAVTNFPIQAAAADMAENSMRFIQEMFGGGTLRPLDMSQMYQPSRGDRIYRSDPTISGESPIDTITRDMPRIGTTSMDPLRYRTVRVETPDGPRYESRIESQPAGYDTRSELPEVQDLMSRAYFGRIYGSLYGVPEDPRTRQDYLVGGHGAGLGWRPSSDVMNYQRYVFRFYAPLLKTAELSDFYRIVENHPNAVSPHLAYALYCASLAKVPRVNRAIADATSFFREAAFYRCPRVIQFYQDPAQPLAEIFGEHMPHHFICGTEGS